MTTALFRTAWLPAPRHTANRQVIECRDRAGLRPQPHATGPDAGVTVIEIRLAIEPRLHVIAHGHDSDRVPLPELRCLDLCRGELSTSPVVIVEPEIILEGVGADDVVLAVGESEHDPARAVLTSGDWLEFHRHVDVGVVTRRSHDDVEFILRPAF